MGQVADEFFMLRALEHARDAALAGEVPVGAVIVQAGREIAGGANGSVRSHDPTAHAEMVALKRAGAAVGNYRLSGSTLFVTLEPCPMCAAALVHARVERVVFGAPDPKSGALGGAFNLLETEAVNHRYAVTGGVLGDACGSVLREFFKARRNRA